MQLTRQSKSTLATISAIVLLFIFFLSRLHNLLILPIFLDEASHITRAQWIWEGQPFCLFGTGDAINRLALLSQSGCGQPFYLLTTGKALAPYLMAVFWPFQGQIFIGRYVVVLLALIGIAACYAVGRELHSRQAGLLGMALWIVCPQLMFFERMALVDTTISAMGMLTLWIAIRMIRSGHWRTAILCGIGLALCVFAKTTGIVYLPIPIMAAVLIRGRTRWTIRARQAILAYMVAGLLLIGPTLYVQSSGYDPTGVKYGLTTVQTDSLPKRAQANAEKILGAEQIYFSNAMLGLMAASAFIALFLAPRATLILLALTAAPLIAVIAVAAALWLRYASPADPFALLVTAIGLVALADSLIKLRVPRLVSVVPWALAAIWAVNVGLPFEFTAYTNPAVLRLPQGDRFEYMDWIPSGYGVKDAVSYLLTLVKTPTTVIVTAANCDGAHMYVPRGSPLTVVCPGIDWGGGNENIVQMIQAEADADGQTYVLGEDAPIVRETQLPTPRTVLATFPRPNSSGYYAVKVYEIEGNAATGSAPRTLHAITQP